METKTTNTIDEFSCDNSCIVSLLEDLIACADSLDDCDPEYLDYRLASFHQVGNRLKKYGANICTDDNWSQIRGEAEILLESLLIEYS